MKAKFWNGYESIMIFIICVLDLIKKAFIAALPVGGAVACIFLISGLAGGCDYGSISEFIANVFKTVIAYIALMLLRYYIITKEE